MSYIITDPCIGTKDTACVDACPVDCIHPRKDEGAFPGASMLYINPDECIDCGACEPACPVQAIYASEEDTPISQQGLIEANRLWYTDPEAAEALVKEHMDSHPELMALAPNQRAAAHNQ